MGGKYQVYPTYKESGESWCGKVPYGWDVQRTKWLFEIKKRIAGELGHSILSITQKGIKVKDTESGEGQLSMDYSKYQLVYVGDFAMNHMDLLTGYVDISKFTGVTSPDYRVFRSKNDSIIDGYFLYLFQMAYINRIYFPLGQGSSHLGRWRLPTEGFYDFRLPVPPKYEQEVIANFLDHETAKIDTLIDKQQQLIKLLQEKRQAVISHAVTKGLNPDAPMKDSGVEWLGEVPEHWVLTPLKYICTLIDGDRSSVYPGQDDLVDTGIPFVSSKNIVGFKFTRTNLNYITEQKFESLTRGKLKDGDLVITVRGTIGHVAVFDADIIGCDTGFINAQMMIIRPEKGLTEYLRLCSESVFWQRQLDIASYGATVMQLSNSVVGSLLLALPSYDEMKRLVSELDQLCSQYNRLINKANFAINLFKERRTALISSAVTGKIDVRGWQPKHSEPRMDASA